MAEGDCGCDRLWRTDRVYVIADIGSNHAGSLSLALNLIQTAKEVGANAAKFQLYRFADVYRRTAKVEPYPLLAPDWIPELAAYAKQVGIDFLCTPFAPWAVEVLRPHVKYWKIGSFEALREDLWDLTGDKVRIVSLGMTTGDEAEKLLAKDQGAVWMHCVSRYPTNLPGAALGRMPWLQRHGQMIGFSDHTLGNLAGVMAVALGARVVERHLKADHKVQPKTPDSGDHAMDPGNFSWYVRAVNEAAGAMTNEFRVPTHHENRLTHGH